MEGLPGKGKAPHTGKVLGAHRLELVRLDKGRSASTIEEYCQHGGGGGDNTIPRITHKTPILMATTNPIFSFVLIFNPHNSRHGNKAKDTSHTPDSTALNSP